MTSHDVVALVRRRLQIRKVGHCGTLDPIATGLLLLTLGRGTKIQDLLMAEDKEYSGTMMFGVTTSTQDKEGELIEQREVPGFEEKRVRAAFDKFRGDFYQTPPMVSAIKKDGVPLYKLARKGIEVEREPRLIHIYSFRFSDYREPLATFKLACTKGTYVRSVAHDLGQKLGCGAHLATLRRTVSGKFDVADAIEFEEVMKLGESDLEKRVIPFLKLARP